MATILVDYENVSTIEGLKGAEYLNENDTLIFYIAAECGCLAKSEAKQICRHGAKTPMILYTGSLHEFGREDGRAIYQMLKQVV